MFLNCPTQIHNKKEEKTTKKEGDRRQLGSNPSDLVKFAVSEMGVSCRKRGLRFWCYKCVFVVGVLVETSLDYCLAVGR